VIARQFAAHIGAGREQWHGEAKDKGGHARPPTCLHCAGRSPVLQIDLPHSPQCSARAQSSNITSAIHMRCQFGNRMASAVRDHEVRYTIYIGHLSQTTFSPAQRVRLSLRATMLSEKAQHKLISIERWRRTPEATYHIHARSSPRKRYCQESDWVLTYVIISTQYEPGCHYH
jgi:hypothetical protein